MNIIILAVDEPSVVWKYIGSGESSLCNLEQVISIFSSLKLNSDGERTYFEHLVEEVE